MSGNFVHRKRERQHIVYLYNLHNVIKIFNIFNVNYICKQYAAARACGARNYQTFLGRLWLKDEAYNYYTLMLLR